MKESKNLHEWKSGCLECSQHAFLKLCCSPVCATEYIVFRHYLNVINSRKGQKILKYKISLLSKCFIWRWSSVLRSYKRTSSICIFIDLWQFLYDIFSIDFWRWHVVFLRTVSSPGTLCKGWYSREIFLFML